MINAVGNRLVRETARQSQLANAAEKLQIQISTGTRLQRMSDDPSAADQVTKIDRDRSNIASWNRNISFAAARVAQADTILATTSSLIIRAKELVLAASNAATSAQDRGSIANEIVSIADEISALEGSTAPNGEPVFSTMPGRAMRFDAATSFVPVPGRDTVFGTGSQNLAMTVRDAATALRNGNATGMAGANTSIDTAISHVADQRAAIGLAGARIDRISEVMAERRVTLGQERSDIADTDLSEAIAQLNAHTLTREAAQAAFARINRQNLFDLLR